MFKTEEIIQHYDECDTSYQHWGEHEIYEMHYGYWDKTVKNHGDSLLKMNNFLMEVAKINNGDKILDAGCGVGAMPIWLTQHYKNIEITGISISKEQIGRANIFAKKYGVDDRTGFFVRDYLKTGFLDGSFDIIFAIESVCHTENKNDFIKEAFRVLKPSGRLIVGDFFLAKEKLNILEKKLMYLFLNGWTVPNLATKENFSNFLNKTGFKNLKHLDITQNILPSSKNMFRRGCVGLLEDKITKHKNSVQYANTVTCFFQYITLKIGLWKYLVFYAEK